MQIPNRNTSIYISYENMFIKIMFMVDMRQLQEDFYFHIDYGV